MCLATHKNVFDESSEVPDHLKPLIENTCENLTESERGELKNLIVEFGDNNKLPPRRLPLKQKKIIDKELDKMLKDNII